MDVRIAFEDTTSPAGFLAAESADPLQFSGWLGLLRALAEALAVSGMPVHQTKGDPQ